MFVVGRGVDDDIDHGRAVFRKCREQSRPQFFKSWKVTDFVRPDEAVARAGVKPEEVTDLILTHAHWDHADGADLFPKAQIWIQKEEYRYYTGEAWQSEGKHGGIELEDMQS